MIGSVYDLMQNRIDSSGEKIHKWIQNKAKLLGK